MENSIDPPSSGQYRSLSYNPRLVAAKEVVAKEMAILSRNPSERFKSLLAKKMERVLGSSAVGQGRNDKNVSESSLSILLNQSSVSDEKRFSSMSSRLLPPEEQFLNVSDQENEQMGTFTIEKNDPERAETDLVPMEEKALSPSPVKYLKQSLILNQAARTPRATPLSRQKQVLRPSITQMQTLNTDTFASSASPVPMSSSIKATTLYRPSPMAPVPTKPYIRNTPKKPQQSLAMSSKKSRKPDFIVPTATTSTAAVSRSGLRMSRQKELDREKERLLEDNDQRLKMALEKLMKEAERNGTVPRSRRGGKSVYTTNKLANKPHSMYRTPQPLKTTASKIKKFPQTEPTKTTRFRQTSPSATRNNLRSKDKKDTSPQRNLITHTTLTESLVPNEDLFEKIKQVLESKLAPFVHETHFQIESLARRIESVAISNKHDPESESATPESIGSASQKSFESVDFQTMEIDGAQKSIPLLDSPELLPDPDREMLPINGDLIELCPTPPPRILSPADGQPPSELNRDSSPRMEEENVSFDPTEFAKVKKSTEQGPFFEQVDRDGANTKAEQHIHPNFESPILIQKPSKTIPPRSSIEDTIPFEMICTKTAEDESKQPLLLWLPLSVQRSIFYGRDRRMEFLQEFLGTITTTNSSNGFVIEGPWDAIQKVSEELAEEMFNQVLEEIAETANGYVENLVKNEIAI